MKNWDELPNPALKRVLFFSNPLTRSQAAQVHRNWWEAANQTWLDQLKLDFPDYYQLKKSTFNDNTNYFKVYLDIKLDHVRAEMQTQVNHQILDWQAHLNQLLHPLLTEREIHRRDFARIESCLYAGYDVNYEREGRLGKTTLLYKLCKHLGNSYLETGVARERIIFLIELAIAMGANTLYVNPKQHSIFHHLICRARGGIKYPEIFQILKKYRHDFTRSMYLPLLARFEEPEVFLATCDELSLSPADRLCAAIRSKDQGIFEFLTFRAEDFCQLDERRGNTLLHETVLQNDPQLLRTVLAAPGHFDFEVEDRTGKTPLQLALEFKLETTPFNLSMIFLLLTSGASALKCNANLDNHHGFYNAVKKLLRQFAPIRVGKYPMKVEQVLQEAIRDGESDVVLTLANGGAVILPTPSNQWVSAAEFAVRCGQLTLAKQLAHLSLALLVENYQDFESLYVEDYPNARTLSALQTFLPRPYQFLLRLCGDSHSREFNIPCHDDVCRVAGLPGLEARLDEITDSEYDFHAEYPEELNLIQSACVTGNVGLVRHLLDKGVSACMTTTVRREVIADLLGGEGVVQEVRLSLLALAIAHAGSRASTPENYLELISLLIDRGADVTETQKRGPQNCNLLDFARRFESPDEIIALLEEMISAQQVATLTGSR